MTIIYDVWWRLIGLSFWVFGIWGSVPSLVEKRFGATLLRNDG
jgi:hypothetical protein